MLVLADKAASLGDFRQYLRGLIDGSSQQIRRRLEQSDPYYCQRRRAARATACCAGRCSTARCASAAERQVEP